MSGLDFRVLGHLQVLRDGQPLALSPKHAAVLAVLLTRVNRTVSTDLLVDAVWGDEATKGTVANLQVQIGELRTTLDREAKQRWISTVQPGYRLTLDADAFDLLRFQRTRTEGDAARAAGDAVRASAAYRAALADWTGDPVLADLRHLPFAEEFAVGVEEELLGVLHERIEADLACRRHDDLVAELRSLTTRHPLREEFWRQLIIALFRSGRHVDADAAFHQLAEALRAEVGAQPTPELQALWGSMGDGTDLPDRYTSAPVAGRGDRTVAEDHHRPAWLTQADGTRTAVGHGKLTIGRLPDNDLVLAVDRVSRHHAVVMATPSGYVLDDLRSLNGTAVNGTMIISTHPLSPGDTITICGVDLVFQLGP